MHPDPQPTGSPTANDQITPGSQFTRSQFTRGRIARSRIARVRIARGGINPSGALRWWIRLLVRSALLLPLTLTGLIVALVGRHRTAANFLRSWQEPSPTTSEESTEPPLAPLLWTLVLLVPLGAVSLLIALLSTLNEVRVVLLYWLTDGGSISATTWGGPTLAGAWAVHAVLGILLFPVFTAVLAGLDVLARRLADRLKKPNPLPRWVLPTTILADLLSLAFLIAFIRQL